MALAHSLRGFDYSKDTLPQGYTEETAVGILTYFEMARRPAGEYSIPDVQNIQRDLPALECTVAIWYALDSNNTALRIRGLDYLLHPNCVSVSNVTRRQLVNCLSSDCWGVSRRAVVALDKFSDGSFEARKEILKQIRGLTNLWPAVEGLSKRLSESGQVHWRASIQEWIARVFGRTTICTGSPDAEKSGHLSWGGVLLWVLIDSRVTRVSDEIICQVEALMSRKYGQAKEHVGHRILAAALTQVHRQEKGVPNWALLIPRSSREWGNRWNQLAIAEVVGRLRLKDYLASLVGAMTRKDPAVEVACAQAMFRLGHNPESTSELLVRALDHKDCFVRGFARRSMLMLVEESGRSDGGNEISDQARAMMAGVLRDIEDEGRD